MQDELADLLETAVYREVVSQALYAAAKKLTDDPSASALLQELEEDETRHAQMLRDLDVHKLRTADWHEEKVPQLRIAEYLTGPELLEGAGFQDTLVFAMKREQEAVEFYSRMVSVLRNEHAKRLCEKLIHDELGHKLRIEMLYDDLFYRESY